MQQVLTVKQIVEWSHYYKHSHAEGGGSAVSAEQTLEQQKAIFAQAQTAFAKANKRK
jgi:hypothetical protein